MLCWFRNLVDKRYLKHILFAVFSATKDAHTKSFAKEFSEILVFEYFGYFSLMTVVMTVAKNGEGYTYHTINRSVQLYI